jgi:hypothetical protein
MPLKKMRQFRRIYGCSKFAQVASKILCLKKMAAGVIGKIVKLDYTKRD